MISEPLSSDSEQSQENSKEEKRSLAYLWSLLLQEIPTLSFSPARSVFLEIKILHKIRHFKHLKVSKQETAGVQKPSEIHLLEALSPILLI